MRMRRLYQTFTFSGSGKVKRGRSRRFYDNLSLEERNGINNVQTISTSLSKALILLDYGSGKVHAVIK